MPHDNIQPNRSDVPRGSDGCEREKRLVGAADGQRGGCHPVLRCAFCQDCAGHAVGEEGEGEDPEEEEGDLQEEGEFWGEAPGPVYYCCEEGCYEGEEGGDEELCL